MAHFKDLDPMPQRWMKRVKVQSHEKTLFPSIYCKLTNHLKRVFPFLPRVRWSVMTPVCEISISGGRQMTGRLQDMG